MSIDELKKRFPNASRSFIEANADIALATFYPEVSKSHAGTPLVKAPQRKATRRPRLAGRSGPIIRIAIVALYNRGPRKDSHDNLPASYKPLADAIAEWFGLDDAESEIEWTYSQIHRPGEAGTIVIVEKICNPRVNSFRWKSSKGQKV